MPKYSLRTGLLLAAAVLAIVIAASVNATARADQHAAAVPDGVFAIIDGEQISHAEFRSFLVQYARNKFYHGITEETLAQVRDEAVTALIEERLLVHEAARRGIAGDPDAVEKELAGYKARYKDSPNWPEIQKLWPDLRARLLEKSKVDMLEESIRRVDDPGDVALRKFYQDSLELFTQPERIHLSVILLGVDPMAGPDEWRAAKEKAGELSSSLQGGSGFDALARQYSTHESGAKGGDLGQIHKGMLSEPAQKAVGELKAGEVTPPVRVLEGYALFKLHERLPAQVSGYDEVRDRALALYRRQKTDEQWTRFIASLRAGANIVVDSGQHADPRN